MLTHSRIMIAKILDRIDPAILYAFLLLAKAIQWAFDIVFEAFMGQSLRYGSLEERIRSRDYEFSAHRVRVLARGAWTVMVTQNDRYFLTR